jgi:hypothetical protein
MSPGSEIMWEIQICSSSEALLRGDPSGSTMRAVVRAVDPLRCVDPRTPVLYSPAQISPAQISPAQISPAQTTTCHASSRIRKRADGVPCLLHRRHRLSRTRDPAVKALCHVNDGAQLDVRRADLKRLVTGGFVTEFGTEACMCSPRRALFPTGWVCDRVWRHGRCGHGACRSAPRRVPSRRHLSTLMNFLGGRS